MGAVSLEIDGRRIQASPEMTVLEAVRAAGIYVPALCSHPSLPTASLPPSERVYRGLESFGAETPQPAGCGLCVIEVDGEENCQSACHTSIRPDMVVHLQSERVRSLRQRNLSRILANHPHACLTCAQKQGCSRTQCSSNVPESERCCEKLGNCELEKIAEYIGIATDTPRYRFAGLPVFRDEPLFTRNYNLCIGCRRCVRACQQVRGAGAIGYVWRGDQAVIGTLATSLQESGCKFCGTCVEVCPTGALRDKTPYTDKSATPCRQACPIGLDIPSYVHFIAQGEMESAAAVIRQKLPFAATLGRVCNHPCESACRRAQLNEPVAICSLKRFVADAVPSNGHYRIAAGEDSGKLPRPMPSGRSVAIVGAGPSGLTAALFLASKGHAVTVFEAMPEPGGMLRYGLAEYRLPTDVVATEINAILRAGIELHTNSPVTLPDLQQRGYDAIYIAAGASRSKRIPLQGSEMPGVFWGLDFLRRVRSGERVDLRRPVVVVGGGNVAMDVARTALRLAGSPVWMACLESRKEMPAFERDIEEALAEGIIIETSWGPKAILGESSIRAIDFVRCTSVFDEQKRFAPQFDPSEAMRLEAGSVILAIGQTTDLSFLDGNGSGEKAASSGSREPVACAPGSDLPRVRTRGPVIEVADDTLATAIPGVFAGGDVAGGFPSVASAIAMGRKAACSIDRYLGGNGEIDQPLPAYPPASDWLGSEPGFAARSRAAMPALPLDSRVEDFAEVDLGFDRAAAIAEAQRCLQCSLRARIAPVPFPPACWLEMKPEVIATVPDGEGVIELLNSEKEVLQISGTASMRRALQEHLSAGQASYFLFEEEKMYTKRESELLQSYLSKHGKLPKGNDLPDDLF